jgi:hypothetical protein
MISKIVDIGFRGRKNFSPIALSKELGLAFNIMSDPTIPAKMGRYKGEKPPFGLAYYRIDFDQLENTLLFLLKNKTAIDEAGVEEIIVHLFPAENATHIESKLVHLLSELGTTIELHLSQQELQAA